MVRTQWPRRSRAADRAWPGLVDEWLPATGSGQEQPLGKRAGYVSAGVRPDR